jgi:hypothetical protein
MEEQPDQAVALITSPVASEETFKAVGGPPSSRAPEGQARVAQFKAQIEETTSDYGREKLEERLAKLAGGVAVLRVGRDRGRSQRRRTASMMRSMPRVPRSRRVIPLFAGRISTTDRFKSTNAFTPAAVSTMRWVNVELF